MKLFLIILACFFTSKSYAQVADSSFCNRITKEYDEFENETTFRTPILKSCSLSKHISKKGTFYYLSLTAKGRTPNFNIKGVKIILSNNQIISFPCR